MDRNKALDKIRKCLALGGSPNANEAAIAMRQAQKLMLEFDVSGLEASAPKIDGHSVPAASKTGAGWEGQVAMAVADALGIEVYRKKAARWSGTGAAWVFYGNADRIGLAEYAHLNLRRAVVKARTQFIKAMKVQGDYGPGELRAQGRSFAYGFAAEVKKSVQALFMSPEEEAAIVAWKKERGLVLHSRRSTGRLRADGYNSGKAAGTSFGMNRPINGSPGVAGYLN